MMMNEAMKPANSEHAAHTNTCYSDGGQCACTSQTHLHIEQHDKSNDVWSHVHHSK